MDEAIKAALSKLDPANDEHWTSGGLPSMPVMKELVGKSDLTRAEVAAVAPGFDRVNASAAPSDLSNVGGGNGAGPTDNGPTEEQIRDAEFTAREELGERVERKPTADEIAKFIDDPILLLEAFCIVASGDKYRRNNGLMNLCRAYQVEQGGIRAMQDRLDLRDAERLARSAADNG